MPKEQGGCCKTKNTEAALPAERREKPGESRRDGLPGYSLQTRGDGHNANVVSVCTSQMLDCDPWGLAGVPQYPLFNTSTETLISVNAGGR